jgi:2-oxoglutarate ferredoxin oxidoreductase subunit gamma
MLLIDADLVELTHPRSDIDVRSIPATRIAESVLGRKIVANIVMLGFVAANTDIVSVDGLREAVLTSIPKGTEELNLKAFEHGYLHRVQQAEPT